MDSRIGSRFLNAGVGFGGSCFRKDILHLSYLCEYYGLPEVSRYWESVVEINDWQIDRFFQKILLEQYNNLSKKIIVLLGFSFKENTGDTRDSPAIPICEKLLAERANIRIHDPQALDNARLDLEKVEGNVNFYKNVYEAAEGAGILVLITKWEEYRLLDFEKIYERMLKPAHIFDGRNHLDHFKLFKIGFNVFPLGKPPLKHE